MKKNYILSICLLVLNVTAYAQSPNAGNNYIMQNVVKSPGHKTGFSLNGLPVDSINRIIQYIDGLGRPLQAVQWKGSPTGKDLVQLSDYDNYGREAKKYLPYAEQTSADGSFKSAAHTNQTNFYSTGSGWDANVPKTIYTYGENVFDQSPMNHVLEEGAPGASWQLYNAGIGGSGHTKKQLLTSNVSADSVKLWVLISGGAQTTVSYTAGTLYKSIIKDENWVSGKTGTIEEFKDKQGHLVLKKNWQSETSALKTWYIYDDRNNLRYVIPPIVNTNTTTSFVESDTEFLNFMYGYHYDGRRRQIEKKIPGKGWDHIVYNKLDQVVMSQDSMQRINNKWLFVKYDVFGRTVLTGIISSSSTRATWQTSMNSASVLWESRDNTNASSTGTGYTNNALPAHNIVDRYYTINYYDNYSFYGNSSTYDPTLTVSNRTNGLATASKVNILGSSTMLLTVIYYDKDGRNIEAIADNHLSGKDRVINTFNFAGEITATTRTHIVGATTTTIANTFTYDHMGRPLSTIENINSQGAVVLSKREYNELGVLKQKKLHSTNGGSTFLQTTKFAYNIRGWLKETNSAEFKMKLGYDTTAHPQYNGNIATQEWGSSYGNKFLYTYDPLNRLTNGTSTGVVMSEALTYDLMGNIKTLNRDGAGAATYSYSGNRLTGISGGGLTTTSYTYDGNGNATTDGRTGVGITYNYLNLPVTAIKTGLSLTYTYTAAGEKLTKVSSTAGTTDYVGGIQYHGGAIDLIQTPEGVARNNSGTYIYEYNLVDHLGNVRYTFNKNPVTGAVQALQTDDYYAFGKRYSSGTVNKYLYNGKELQEELEQYDYGARFYDPVIGRWNVIDPMAENGRRWSPYNYTFNNPIRFTDPDGMWSLDDAGNPTTSDPEDIKNFLTPLLSGANDGGIDNWFRQIGEDTFDQGHIHGVEIAAKKVTVGDLFWRRVARNENPFVGPRGDEVLQWYNSVRAGSASVKNDPVAKAIYFLAEAYAGGEIGGAVLGRVFDWSIEFIMGSEAAGETIEGVMGAVDAEANAATKVAGEAGAAEAGENIALGVREHLGEFAKKTGGSTWETWGIKNFQTQFLETINNPANKIHFNLDGVGNVWKAVSDGAKGFGKSQHVTSWELYQIYSNPGALGRTIFYQGGKIIPNPF